MCGIVGAASSRNVVPILIEGIRRLEYRGYDSTGLAVLDSAHDGALKRLVSTARVADLDAQAQARHLAGTTGISHTRWATHGAPSPVNAHPHVSGGEIAVVHNGIIENFEVLRERLQKQGYTFHTQTDSEIGKRVNVGAGTITCNYDGANKHKTIIEDDAFIGSDTQLVAPVRVGKGATLGAGTTLTRDAPADQLTVSRAKQVSIPGWKRPTKHK